MTKPDKRDIAATIAAEFDAIERIAARTDADLYMIEQTGFFSRLPVEGRA